MRISEASRRSGVSARMLRHYDALGLVRPSGRTANGYRDYSEGDLRRLLHVEALRALGMSLQQVGDALRPAASEAAPGALVRELIARSRERLAAERALLARLEQLDGIGPADWGEALDAVRLARGLGSDDPLARQRAAIELGAAPVGDPAAAAGPGVLAEALLAEAEPNAAGALRWALVRAAPGPEVLADALLDPRLPRRTRAVEAIAAFG
ncbi:MerR family transcriptional regulator, partial [Leucobacter chromiireducens]|uniref:MerR family transcriptional regulator n=1 Tax=Leucobacter chromiireducens TaxID=283877 RepID=UPI0013DDA634